MTETSSPVPPFESPGADETPAHPLRGLRPEPERAELERATTLESALYWLLPLLLALVQLAFCREARQILRYEDLAEGIRGPFWLDQHALYDGISTNVGWYALLLAGYRLFGFSLYAALWIRVALYTVAMFAVAYTVRRFLAPRAAAPLVATIGLSPSLLFFDTMQTSFGTDLLYFALCLALLTRLRFRPSGTAPPAWLEGALWAIAMIAWLSYPVFLFYLPLLALLHVYARRGTRSAGRLRSPAISICGFLLPLAAATLWLGGQARLFYDPATGSGVFRGGGGGFDLTPRLILDNVLRVGRDLLLRGRSYYFWIDGVELGTPLGWLVALVVVALTLWLLRARPGLRALIATLVALAIANVLLTSASLGPQGLRRCTFLLAALYLLYAVVWHQLLLWKGPYGRRGRTAALVCCLLLPAHHLLVAPGNLRQVAEAGRQQASPWFEVEASAALSLQHWLDTTAADTPLDCRSLGLVGEDCRYGGVFAALDGYRSWNGVERPTIRAMHPRTGASIALDLEAFDSADWQ